MDPSYTPGMISFSTISFPKFQEVAPRFREFTGYTCSFIIRKDTWFKSLRVNCWDIKEVTSKCQVNFLQKTFKQRSKTGKVNIAIEFYIFEIV